MKYILCAKLMLIVSRVRNTIPISAPCPPQGIVGPAGDVLSPVDVRLAREADLHIGRVELKRMGKCPQKELLSAHIVMRRLSV